MMRVTRAIFMAAVLAALALYAFDCFAASTPDVAMQCCDSMPCPEHSHGGSQDCCQTMPSLHAPFTVPHSVDTASHPLMPLAGLHAPIGAQGMDFQAPIRPAVGADWHAPPDAPIESSIPLRI